jgi:hypothetical protein
MKRRDRSLTDVELFILVALVGAAAILGIIWYTLKHLHD